MTLVLRPAGRGKWNTVELSLTGPRAAPLLVKVGEKFELGGIVWRVVEVRA